MKLIGITGNIASGKSTISKIIAEYCNVPLVNVDDFSKGYVATYPLLIDSILRKMNVRDFSLSIHENIKSVIFKDKKVKNYLEQVIGNAFWRYMQYGEVQKHPLIVVEHPIMFELSHENKFDFIIGVHANDDIRVDRMKKRGYCHETITERIINQTPILNFSERIDLVLYNSIPLTKEQIIYELQNSRSFEAFISKASIS